MFVIAKEEKLIFQEQVRCYIPFEKCVNSVCKNEYEYYFESSLHFW